MLAVSDLVHVPAEYDLPNAGAAVLTEGALHGEFRCDCC